MRPSRIAIFAIGPIVGGVLGAVIIPIISWMFSPEDVGRFYLLQTVVGVAVILVYLGLDQAYVREFHESGSHPGLLRATFIPPLAISVLVVAAAVPFRGWISTSLYALDSPVLFWVTAGCILAAVVSRQQSLVLRMSERALAFSASQLLPKIVLLAILAFVFLTEIEPTFGVLGGAFFAASISVMVVYLMATRRDWIAAFVPRPALVPRSRLLYFGFPLMLASFAYWGLTASSAFVLRAYSDLEQLGVYSVTVSVAGIAAIVQGVFTLVWSPIVYKWVAVGADMGRLAALGRQAVVVVVLVLGGCGGFYWMLDFVLPAEYGAVKYLVFSAMLQPLLYTLSEITGIGVTITRRTGYSLITTGVAMVVGLSLNFVLVGPYGATGAVTANAIALMVFFVGRTEMSAHLWRGFRRSTMYVVVTFGACLAVATALLGPSLASPIVSVAWVTYAAVGVLIFRHDLVALIVLLRGRRDDRQ